MSTPRFPKPFDSRHPKSADNAPRPTTEHRPTRTDAPTTDATQKPARPPRPARPAWGKGPATEGSKPAAPYRQHKNRQTHPAPPTAPKQELSPHTEPQDTEVVAPVFLPGVKPVLEFLTDHPEQIDLVYLRKGRHGAEKDSLMDLCREKSVRFMLLEPEAFARIYTGSSQGVVARLFEAGFVEVDALFANIMEAPLPLILALDQVQDPGNAGTLARTLYALGGAGLLIPRHNGVYLGAAAAKASAGALGKLPVAKAANLGNALATAQKMGITVYGTASAPVTAEASNKGPDTQELFSLRPYLPAVLVLGSEDTGMRPGLEKHCDTLLRIPMLRQTDSLNVAQAGAIIMAWFAHTRGQR